MKATLGITLIDTRILEVLQETRIIASIGDLMQMLQPRVTRISTRFERESIGCDGMSVGASLINNVFLQLLINERM
jgi:hypothetical protein